MKKKLGDIHLYPPLPAASWARYGHGKWIEFRTELGWARLHPLDKAPWFARCYAWHFEWAEFCFATANLAATSEHDKAGWMSRFSCHSQTAMEWRALWRKYEYGTPFSNADRAIEMLNK